MPLKTSREGAIFLGHQEALALVAYPDGGDPSAGFGHNDPTLKVGQTITVRQAFDWLRADLEKFEASLNKGLKVPVAQHQFDALISLHYQSGNRYLPAILQLVNAGHPEEAAVAWARCDRNKAGVQLAGLTKRRLREQALFLRGEYGPLDPIPFFPGDPRTTKRQEYRLQPGDL